MIPDGAHENWCFSEDKQTKREKINQREDNRQSFSPH